MTESSPFPNDKLTMVVTSVICLIWAASVLASFVNTTFNPPEGVNIAFGAVTGYIFNRQLRKDNE